MSLNITAVELSFINFLSSLIIVILTLPIILLVVNRNNRILIGEFRRLEERRAGTDESSSAPYDGLAGDKKRENIELFSKTHTAVLEIQSIEKDTRSILHDSRHIQNENLQTSYLIRSTLTELNLAVEKLNFAQDAILRTIEPIGIQSHPLIGFYLDLLEKNIDLASVGRSYQLDRYVKLLSPTLTIKPLETKVAIASVIRDATQRASVEPCLNSHRNYAKNHGYAYYLLESSLYNSTIEFRSWKLAAIYALFDQGFDAVLFVEPAVMFTNLNKRVDSLLHAFEPSKTCIAATENASGVDLSVFAVKNCAQSKIILDMIWSIQKYIYTENPEEYALNYLTNNYDCVRKCVRFEKNPKNMNSDPLEKCLFKIALGDKIWSDGDLICNFSDFKSPHLEAVVRRYGASLAFRAGNRAEAISQAQPTSIEPMQNKDVPQGGTVSCSILGRWGQFGNQLFQIAAVFGYARRYGAKVILPPWHCVMSEQDHGSRFPKVQAYYGEQPSADPFYEPTYAYNDIPYKSDVDLQGSFQSERYFAHITDEIRELFSEPEEIKFRLDEFVDKFNCKTFDALHVRNYLHPTRDIGFGDMERLPEAYFVTAIQRIDDTIPLFVATDKKDFVEDVFRKIGLRRRVITMDNDDPLMDFYMLSRARRIAISNSSFSWWSAYLGRQKENVIAPHRYYWFSSKGRTNPHYDTRDLYPPNFEEIIM